jgi:hypothetical protein
VPNGLPATSILPIIGNPVAGLITESSTADPPGEGCQSSKHDAIRFSSPMRFAKLPVYVMHGYTLSAFTATRASASGMPVSPALPELHARIVIALTEARQEAKLRQVDLAKRLGWQQAYVSRYETGERMLAVDEFVAVARAIGVDPVALLAQVLNEGNDGRG